MKKCSNCGILKEDVEFSKKLKHLASYCKPCDTKIRTLNYRSKEGTANRLYSSQLQRCKRRLMDLPEYSKEDFKLWVMAQDNFDYIFNEWVKSDYNREYSPSIDRLDDYKTYSFDNIRLVTCRENREAYKHAMLIGTNTKSLTPVYKCDLDGKILKEYHSIADAGRDLLMKSGSNITSACKNGGTCYGYKWRYKEDER